MASFMANFNFYDSETFHEHNCHDTADLVLNDSECFSNTSVMVVFATVTVNICNVITSLLFLFLTIT